MACTDLNINRHDVLEKLAEFVMLGSGVIIGEPGIGKTCLLNELKSLLKSKNINHMVLKVESLGDGSDDDIKQVLGLTGNELLNRLGKSEEGILLIDAFDAARNATKRANFLKLIKRAVEGLENRWKVIVTVRTYDAQRSPELQDRFKGFLSSDGHENRNPNITCRHFEVPKLTDSEVEGAVRQIPKVSELFKDFNKDLKYLLRVPFNLWLLSRVVNVADAESELTPIRSEVQLLELFWQRRVRSGEHYEVKDAIVSQAVNQMVDNNILMVNKDDIYKSDRDMEWKQLFSDGILAESKTTHYRIAFTHNILFDYAASLIMPPDAKGLEEFLAIDASRPLFLRPSLTYYFARAWYFDNGEFWKLFWYFMSSSEAQMRLFARLIPTAVLVREIRRTEDFLPLIEKFERSFEQASNATLRVLQARRAFESERLHPWSEYFVELSKRPDKKFAWDLAVSIDSLLGISKQASANEVVEHCGMAARNLLAWVWDGRVEGDKTNDHLGASWLVPLVAKTYGFAPDESRKALSPVLELLKESNFPVNFVWRLCHEVDNIWGSDPTFVADIYTHVFGYYESSNETTPMGTPVMPMTSTRRQDYEMSWYSLSEKYPKYLRTSPITATRACVLALSNFIIARHIVGYLNDGVGLQDITEKVELNGKIVNVVQDHSFIWDSSEYIDTPIKIGVELFNFIDELANDTNKLGLIDEILNVIFESSPTTFFVRRLFGVASNHPKVFLPRLYELLIAKPILTGEDALYEVGKFIESAAEVFGEEELHRLESTILSIPSDAEDEEERGYYEKRRNRLLARLPYGRVSKESKAILDDLKKKDEVPSNVPLARFTSWSKPYSYKDALKESGVDTSLPEVSSILELTDAARAFSNEWQNKTPSAESITKILPTAVKLQKLIVDNMTLPDDVIESGWTFLSECCKKIAMGAKDPSSDEFRFAREVLLTCSTHPSPEPDPEHDNNYTSAAWSPAPRIEAAQGLAWIALWQEQPDVEVLSAIEKLVEDKTPQVRFLMTSDLWRISKIAPKCFDERIKYLAETELNTVVQRAILDSLWNYYQMNRDQVTLVEHLNIIFDRVLKDEISGNALEAFSDILLILSIIDDCAWAIDTFKKILDEPIRNSKILNHSVIRPFDVIANERLGPYSAETQNRAVDWLHLFVDGAVKGLNELLKIGATLDDADKTKLQELYGVLDHIVFWSYMAFNKRGTGEIKDDSTQIYWKLKPVMEKVIAFGINTPEGFIVPMTAHRFIEGLNVAVAIDPKGVLQMAHQITKASSSGGFQFDSLAVTDVVKLVNTLLADFKEEIQESESIENLMGLLDAFAEAGWPEAIKLVWRLDEVYR